MVFQKLIMNGDLNASNTLFGGKMMQFIDEAAAIYVMNQLKTKNIVTLKISELLFKIPVILGDILVFEAKTIKTGQSSITIKINVYKTDFINNTTESVTECDLVFVAVDSLTKKPCNHILAKQN
jgi:acyl-CoA hydrolase